MSVVMCNQCDRKIDTDLEAEEVEVWEPEVICVDCYDPTPCCTPRVTSGDHDPDCSHSPEVQKRRIDALKEIEREQSGPKCARCQQSLVCQVGDFCGECGPGN